MKKLVSAILVLSGALVLSSCGGPVTPEVGRESIGVASLEGYTLRPGDDVARRSSLSAQGNVDNAPLPWVAQYQVGYRAYNCVPYEFDSTITAAERTNLIDAAQNMSLYTNVKFCFFDRRSRVKQFIPQNRIVFTHNGIPDNAAGYSPVGMQGGPQPLGLLPYAINTFDYHLIQHELGHAIGLEHEHQRCDRDTYINVSSTLLTGSLGYAYSKICDYARPVRAYDFHSVMHYGDAGMNPHPGQYRPATYAGIQLSLPSAAGPISTTYGPNGAYRVFTDEDVLLINSLYPSPL